MDPAVLVSRCETKLYDFAACDEEELYDITIPLDFKISEHSITRSRRSSVKRHCVA